MGSGRRSLAGGNLPDDEARRGTKLIKDKLKKVALIAVGLTIGLAVAPATVEAAVNYFDVTKTVSGSGSVSCPSGWKVTGGGVASLPANSFGSSTSDEYQLTGSYPTSNGWSASATRVHGTYTSYSGWKFYTYSYTTKVSAICVN